MITLYKKSTTCTEIQINGFPDIQVIVSKVIILPYRRGSSLDVGPACKSSSRMGARGGFACFGGPSDMKTFGSAMLRNVYYHVA
jgi:hypothetical protein